eukprot:366229-Chlamydomonas_euryale.AAC.28
MLSTGSPKQCDSEAHVVDVHSFSEDKSVCWGQCPVRAYPIHTEVLLAYAPCGSNVWVCSIGRLDVSLEAGLKAVSTYRALRKLCCFAEQRIYERAGHLSSASAAALTRKPRQHRDQPHIGITTGVRDAY